MRVVVYTAQADITDSPWWPVLMATHELERVLVCRRMQHVTPRDALRRFARNVRKHGILFIPYRISLLAAAVVARPFRRSHTPPRAVFDTPVEEYETSDLHAAATLDRVRDFAPDLGLSIGAPILRASLFRIPRLGTINLHLGKVPEFRGAPPAFWELVRGASTIGATVHWMDDGLDTGAIISAAEAPIYPHDELRDVDARATELGTIVLRDALDRVAARQLDAEPQRPGGTTNRFPTLNQRLAHGWRSARRRWRARVTLRRAAKRIAMTVALYGYRPVRDAVRTLRRRHPVRVFNFHRVTTLCRDGMTIAPDALREQLTYVIKHHEVVSLERGIELVRSGARLRRPIAVITFDDAYRSVFRAARPTLAELGVVATCFVSTDLAGTDRRFEHDRENPVRARLDVMSWDELDTLKREGWTLGTHTANHVRLAECSGAVLTREIEEPIRALRARLGVESPVLAYPFGKASDVTAQALDVARAAGHTTVLSNFGGENRTGSDALVLNRFDLGGDHERMGWRCMAHGIVLGRWREILPT